MVMIIRKCPHCFDRGIILKVNNVGSENPVYWVECIDCGFEGPKAASGEKAKQEWNRMKLKDFN